MRLWDAVVSLFGRRPWIGYILALIIALIFGTTGYVIIEQWTILESFYMTVITLTTIGFGEIKPLSDAGRMFTLILILFGLFIVAFVINYTTQQIIQGQLSFFLGIGRNSRRVRSMRNHFIICGFGRMGEKVCEQLRSGNVPFVIIESSRERYQDALDEGYVAILGDGTDDDVLREAHIEEARGLVCSVSSDAKNVFITLSSRQLNPKLYILARAAEDNSVNKLMMAGATKVVSPYSIGGRTMANALLRPHVVEFIEFATDNEALDFSIESGTVSAESEFCGSNIIDSQIRSRYNVIILAIRKHDGGMHFNPAPTTILECGDQLIAAGHPDQLGELLAKMEAQPV